MGRPFYFGCVVRRLLAKSQIGWGEIGLLKTA